MQRRSRWRGRAETDMETRVCVHDQVQLQRAGRVAAGVLLLVACQESTAGDIYAIKLKAIVGGPGPSGL